MPGCSKALSASLKKMHIMPTERRRSRSSSHDIPSKVLNNDDLLSEILSRLPLISAFQFKCVSKHWLTIISNLCLAGIFKRDALLFCVKSLSFPLKKKEWDCFTMSSLSGFQRQSLSFVPCFQGTLTERDPQVVGTHNDLILCFSPHHQNKYRREYYVCNPYSKQWVSFPPPRFQLLGNFAFISYVHYNKKEDKTKTQALNACEYRFMVAIINGQCSSQFIVEIFSSETGKWTVSVVAIPGNQHSHVTHSIAYNGMLYFTGSGGLLVRLNPLKKNGVCATSTASGDTLIDKCHFVEFDTPIDGDSLTSFERQYCLGVWQGRLRRCHLVLAKNCPNKLSILSIWELKEDMADGDKWCLIKRVTMNQMVSEDQWIVDRLKTPDCEFTLLALEPNLEETVYIEIKRHIVMCNIGTRTLQIARKSCSQLSVDYKLDAFPIVFPCCPTPLPRLPSNAQVP